MPPVTEPPAPIEWSGTGDQVLDIGTQDRVVLAASHDGSRNFIVEALDANFELSDIPINHIGSYLGSVLLLRGTEDVRYFQVTADGSWSLSLLDVAQLRTFDAAVNGVGDEVLAYTGGPQIMNLSHDGGGNFAIWFISADTQDLVVNEIGAYTGQSPFRKGTAFVAVTADGNWTISP